MYSRFVKLIIILLLPWFLSDVSAQDEHDHASEQNAQEEIDHKGHDHENENDFD